MSRSHKKHPILSTTTAESEKDDKRIGNRKLRRAVKSKLQRGFDDIDDAWEHQPDDVLDQYYDHWNAAKDGKGWVGWNSPHIRKWMRK
jgi:hypothetical protein